jgi:hypothetical protein
MQKEELEIRPMPEPPWCRGIAMATVTMPAAPTAAAGIEGANGES